MPVLHLRRQGANIAKFMLYLLSVTLSVDNGSAELVHWITVTQKQHCRTTGRRDRAVLIYHHCLILDVPLTLCISSTADGDVRYCVSLNLSVQHTQYNKPQSKTTQQTFTRHNAIRITVMNRNTLEVCKRRGSCVWKQWRQLFFRCTVVELGTESPALQGLIETLSIM